MVTTGQVATIVTLDILPDKDADFRAIMEAMIMDVRANEPGTLLYYLTRVGEGSRYRMLEIYASADAAAAHSKRDTVREQARAIGACLAAPVIIERLEGVL
jgi:quinol monooxygenase YgiN